MFIHSFRPFLQRPFKSSTTQRRSRLQHGYCIGVSRQRAQATAGKGLIKGPYMAARVGVEPTTLRLKVIVSTKAPQRPTNVHDIVAPSSMLRSLTIAGFLNGCKVHEYAVKICHVRAEIIMKTEFFVRILVIVGSQLFLF